MIHPGIEPELIELMIIQLLGNSFFSSFEGEASPWIKITKWLVLDAIVIFARFFIQHWAVLIPTVFIIPGALIHTRWCRKNGIHPVKATPKKRYYELRGWE